MKRVTLYFLGAVLVLNTLAALLTPSSQAPIAPAPAPALTAAAAPADDDAEPCTRWIAQGFGCEFIVFPEMEIKAQPEAALDNALAATAL